MNDVSKLIEHFYSEALKYDAKSESFLKTAGKVTTFYKEAFGMNETYLTYYDVIYKNEVSPTLELLSKMRSELLEFHKS